MQMADADIADIFGVEPGACLLLVVGAPAPVTGGLQRSRSTHRARFLAVQTTRQARQSRRAALQPHPRVATAMTTAL